MSFVIVESIGDRLRPNVGDLPDLRLHPLSQPNLQSFLFLLSFSFLSPTPSDVHFLGCESCVQRIKKAGFVSVLNSLRKPWAHYSPV